MIPVFPPGLCYRPIRGTTSGGPQDVRLAFEPEAGVPIERPRLTAAPEMFDVTLPPMTLTDFETFRSWFRNDLANGSLAFAWRHPLTLEPGMWRFARGGDTPYRAQAVAKRKVQVAFRAMSQPGTPWWAAYVPADTVDVPSLVLDFAGQVYGLEGARTAFGEVMTFARAGTADYTDANGDTQTAAANVPRFDHAAGVPLGLLLEAAETEVATIGAATWPDDLIGPEATVLAIARPANTAANTSVVNLFSSSGQDRIAIVMRDTQVRSEVADDNVLVASLGHGTVTAGARTRVAFAGKANDFRSVRDGGAVVTDAAGGFPVIASAIFGQNMEAVRIERVLIWNRALPDAVLQGLTA